MNNEYRSLAKALEVVGFENAMVRPGFDSNLKKVLFLR